MEHTFEDRNFLHVYWQQLQPIMLDNSAASIGAAGNGQAKIGRLSGISRRQQDSMICSCRKWGQHTCVKLTMWPECNFVASNDALVAMQDSLCAKLARHCKRSFSCGSETAQLRKRASATWSILAKQQDF